MRVDGILAVSGRDDARGELCGMPAGHPSRILERDPGDSFFDFLRAE